VCQREAHEARPARGAVEEKRDERRTTKSKGRRRDVDSLIKELKEGRSPTKEDTLLKEVKEKKSKIH